jgi:hypothetical protein
VPLFLYLHHNIYILNLHLLLQFWSLPSNVLWAKSKRKRQAATTTESVAPQHTAPQSNAVADNIESTETVDGQN